MARYLPSVVAKPVARLTKRLGRHVRTQTVLLAVPYAWCLLFFLLPFLLILKISLAKNCWGLPPFTDLLAKTESCFYTFRFYLGNYLTLLTDSFYFSAVASSFVLAGASTLVCLLIGYAMAYAISRAPKRRHTIYILMVILPFATSFLVRVYSWMSLLNTHGVVNEVLLALGVISTPIHFLDNNYAVCLGMVYCYLPFMILPIYAALEKMDPSYLEAALDLGASRTGAFWSVTFPLSLPGVFAGCTLVFVPSLGEFVIPELMGGAKTMTIGQAIWCEFFNNRDWPLACAIAVCMMGSFVFYILLSKIRNSLTRKKE